MWLQNFYGKLNKPFGLHDNALQWYLILFRKHSSLFQKYVYASLLVDIAIGAPFAGKDQRGKVLIYNGNKDGLNTKASQILQGVWASQAVPSGFGFTLRGDSDIDKNDYPGKVFFLSSRERIHCPESPFSGKCIMCKQFFHKAKGKAQWHRFLVYDFKVTSRESKGRQNKPSFSWQETMLERQDAFKKLQWT